MLAEFNVDAGKTAADGRGHRTLQAHTGALDRVDQLLGNVFPVFFKSLGAGFVGLPFELDAGSFENAHRRPRHFGSDAIAGDESYFIRRLSHCEIESLSD